MSNWTDVEKKDIEKAFKRRKNLGELHAKLLSNIKAKLPAMEALLEEMSGHWIYEDLIYRFYHNSFKVYYIQGDTLRIIDILKSVAPDNYELNKKFMGIVKEGTGKEFQSSHNKEWEKHTRPMLEAFFHAKAFLEMAVKYGKELKEPPQCLPSGWALLLYYFYLR